MRQLEKDGWSDHDAYIHRTWLVGQSKKKKNTFCLLFSLFGQEELSIITRPLHRWVKNVFLRYGEQEMEIVCVRDGQWREKKRERGGGVGLDVLLISLHTLRLLNEIDLFPGIIQFYPQSIESGRYKWTLFSPYLLFITYHLLLSFMRKGRAIA